jgi:Domain of unknown function (DUF4279)
MGPADAGSDYPTCERCYASLCMTTGDRDPDEVSRYLHIEPTMTQRKGEPARAGSERINPHGGWSLSSKGCVDSKDLRKHLDWVFDEIGERKPQLESLRQVGCEMRVWCYWLSKAGHGGPTLSVPQVKRLAELELEICLDIYFLGDPRPKKGSEIP